MKPVPLVSREFVAERCIPEPMTGCWLWTGPQCPNGYGRCYIGSSLHVRAHRLSYVAHVGPIPDELQVLHRCDTRACVNPDHLFLGTHRDNMLDKLAKGRGAFPSYARLTEQQVLTIRQRRSAGEKTIALAAEFGVSRSTITAVCAGRLWTHVGGPLTTRGDYLAKARKRGGRLRWVPKGEARDAFRESLKEGEA